MTNSHLRLDGTWAECHASVRACPRMFHLEGMTPEQASKLPQSMLDPLFEAIDPPHPTDNLSQTKTWGKMLRPPQLTSVILHREHDLPAVIEPNGKRVWYRKGKLHRDGDKPAMIRADGTLEWWVDGSRHREGGRPAVIGQEGIEWWEHNAQHRENGPAYVSPDGQLMLWYRRGQVTNNVPDESEREDARRWLADPYAQPR